MSKVAWKTSSHVTDKQRSYELIRTAGILDKILAVIVVSGDVWTNPLDVRIVLNRNEDFDDIGKFWDALEREEGLESSTREELSALRHLGYERRDISPRWHIVEWVHCSSDLEVKSEEAVAA